MVLLSWRDLWEVLIPLLFRIQMKRIELECVELLFLLLGLLLILRLVLGSPLCLAHQLKWTLFPVDILSMTLTMCKQENHTQIAQFIYNILVVELKHILHEISCIPELYMMKRY